MSNKQTTSARNGWSPLKIFQLEGSAGFEQSRIPRLAACMLCAGNEAAIKRCAGVDAGQDTLADLDSLVKESVGVVDDTQRLFLHLLSEK